MSEETDVNVQDSSPDTDVTPDSSPETEGHSSEETLNADKPHEESVPYERFREVNDKNKEYEEKLKQYDGINPDLYKSYAQFDEILGSNPELNQQVQDLMRQGLTQKQAVSQVADQQENGVGPDGLTDYQRVNRDNYFRDLTALMDDDEIDEKDRPRVLQLVYNEAGSMNPNALNQYDPKLVKSAYDGVGRFIDGIRRKERESYVKDKTKGDVPPTGSKTGSAPTKKHSFANRDERVAFGAKYIRESMRGVTS